MKHRIIVLILVTTILTSQRIEAQCPIDTSNYDYIVSPQNSSACVGASYNQSFQFVFPQDTVLFGFTIPYDSIQFASINNTPVGLGYSCHNSNCMAYQSAPGSNVRGCISISGTPTIPAYPAVVNVVLQCYTTIPFVGLYTFTDTATFSITVTQIDNTVSTNLTSITANETGAAYQWLDCNLSFAPITLQTSGTYTPTGSGSYAVEITKNGCVDTSSCVSFSLGVSSYQDIQATIYPNPANNYINIQTNNNIEEINVLDISGQLLYVNNNYSGLNAAINIESMRSGVYILVIKTKKGNTFQRLVKK